MFKKFIYNRLQEPSTWRGLILLVAGLIGLEFSPTQETATINVVLAIVGAIGAFTPDKVPMIPEGKIDKNGTEKIDTSKERIE